MTTLVTGGCGVLGSWVVRELLDTGDDVVVFDTRDDDSILREARKKIEVVRGDIMDFDQFADVLKKYNISRIAHMAALLDDAAEQNPYDGFQVNVMGTLNVLEAARNAGINRVVAMSSKSALGLLGAPYIDPTYEPVPVTVRPYPVDVYGATKLCVEEMGRLFASTYDMTFIALRFASTYGPGKTARHGKVGLLSRVVESAFRGEPVVVARGADQKNDFLYCRDVGQAVACALKANITGQHIFQIGSGSMRTLQAYADVVKQLLPESQIEIGPGLDYTNKGIGTFYGFDIQPAQQQIGYQPKFDLARGVADYVAFLREQ